MAQHTARSGQCGSLGLMLMYFQMCIYIYIYIHICMYIAYMSTYTDMYI